MARRRMLDPEFFDDKEFFLQIFSACFDTYPSKSRKFLFRIGRTVRLFYAGLWKSSDDSGRFLDDSVKLKAEIFPFDDDIAQSDIKTFMKVLKKANKVYQYEINKVIYGVVVKFLKHQRIDKPTPSKLPIPPEPQFTEWLQSYSLSYSRETPAQEKLKEVKEKRREVEVKRTHACDPDKPFSFSSSESQNPDQNQTLQYEPGPMFCPSCKKPMADESDKWFCPDCQIRKPKRKVKT